MTPLKKIKMTWPLALLLIAGVVLRGGITLAGKPLDFNAAQQLAIHGDATDQNYLGEMYFTGRGVAQDYQQAVIWFRKAARWGNANALFNLGTMYENGQGVPQDYTQATNWYRKAVEQGHNTADSNIRHIEETIASLLDAAEKGKMEAQVALADLYASGNGVPQSDQQAAEWFKKSAEQGDMKAQYNLGLAYAEGKGIPQDDKQAAAWLKKAAEQDHAQAKYALGRMYFKGQGVPQDNVQAYAWLTLAASQGDGNAASNKNFTANMLTPAQLSEAEDLAATLQATIDGKKKTP